jgi:hypothetical protein
LIEHGNPLIAPIKDCPTAARNSPQVRAQRLALIEWPFAQNSGALLLF